MFFYSKTEYFHSLDSVMRRMSEGQHAVQYGYRLLHPTVCALRV